MKPISNNSVIFTNGCFDVLHRAHFELLKYCKQLGGTVVVGLNSDISVARAKGEDRPFNNQEDRKFMLEACEYVDKVVLFEEDTPYELIKIIQPDVIVKGGDYKVEDIAGHDLAEVKIFNYIEGYSTTRILERI